MLDASLPRASGCCRGECHDRLVSDKSVFAQPPPSLFSASTRAYEGPRAHSESDYAFLDRSARAGCQHVRETLDAWYGRLPVAARGSIRARFVNQDPGHHLGALLELYLHEAFLRLDYEINLDIGQEDPAHRRPDFLLSDGGEAFYLEASAVLGAKAPGERSNPLAAALYEAVDRITAPGFFLRASRFSRRIAGPSSATSTRPMGGIVPR